MRPLPAFFLTLIALPLAGASNPPRTASGPPTVAYSCADGHPASVLYEGGGVYFRAKARITHHGRSYDLDAAPTLYGLRYRGDAGDRRLAWTLQGEEAWLTESPDADGYTREEREIVRCTRVRDGAPADFAGGEAH